MKYIKNIYKYDSKETRNSTQWNRFVCDQTIYPIYQENMQQNIYYIYDKEEGTKKDITCVYIAKKYGGLKQEMLDNISYAISNEQWMDLYQKANDFIKCDTIQQMDNDKTIGIYHCNFEVLSYHLRLTFMRFKDSNWRIEHHREFANWSKLLRDTVHNYGSSIQSEGELHFGINRETLFTDFKVNIDGMLSVSSEYSANYMYSNTRD